MQKIYKYQQFRRALELDVKTHSCSNTHGYDTWGDNNLLGILTTSLVALCHKALVDKVVSIQRHSSATNGHSMRPNSISRQNGTAVTRLQ